jgi:hypothetical protein
MKRGSGEAFLAGAAWQQSALNQPEYCEAHGIPLKAFGNWRAQFKPRTAAAGRRSCCIGAGALVI